MPLYLHAKFFDGPRGPTERPCFSAVVWHPECMFENIGPENTTFSDAIIQTNPKLVSKQI